MNIVQKLSAKHPFIYDTGEFIIAVSGSECKILNGFDSNRVENHKRTFSESNDKEEIQIAYRKLTSYASATIGISKSPQNLQDILSKLKTSEIKALENEILNFEQKYKDYIE